MLNRSVLFIILAILLTTNALADRIIPPDELQDLAVREARFYAFQGEWFNAISRLDNELIRRNKPAVGKIKPLSRPYNQFDTTRIDFELSYRLHQRDGRAVLSVIEGNADDKSRNKLLFRLAKIYFQKGEPLDALLTIDRISGKVLPEIVDDIAFLRAQILMANGRYSDAIVILDELKNAQSYLSFAGYNQKAQSLLGFVGYNLGLAHLLNGNKVEGLRQLDFAGQITSQDETTLSIRDKVNLMLGEQLLKDGLYKQAGLVLDRVRLQGPFSDLSLLSAGWAAVLQNNYKQALVPWTLLSERESTDAAVQKAMIALPYCYGKLNIYNKAAPLYGRAVEVFGVEIDKLAASIASIREERFLKTLVREGLKQETNWIVKLRELPGMPETYYLLDLMASHEFQESLNNYLDLEQLRKKLTIWQQDLQTYEEMIEKRRAFYKPLLPVIDARLKKIDSRMRLILEQRDDVGRQLSSMKTVPQPDLLTTTKERSFLKEIDRVDRSLQPFHIIKTKSRIKRLRGLLYWSINTSYDLRLASTNANFRSLDEDVTIMKDQHDSFIRIRRAATQSYSGHNKRINALRLQIKNVLKNTASVMARQGHLLKTMAEAELIKRRELLKEMQLKARFATAESYDRAATKRDTGGVGR